MASKQNGKQQTFHLVAPAALSVELVGDFTRWKERPVKMQKAADGVWRVAVDLEPGTHRYRFLVDGQWCDDPECALRVPNPYGSQDSVRSVMSNRFPQSSPPRKPLTAGVGVGSGKR